MTDEKPLKLCLLEDDPIMGESLCHRFELEGYEYDWYKTALAAQPHIGNKHYAALISDIRLPDMSGSELYTQLQKEGRHLPPTIFVTGHGSIGDAVELLKKGAADYITKPFDIDSLMEKVRNVCRHPVINSDNTRAVLGISSIMRSIEQTLCHVSKHSTTVLITGESGVGKEHATRYLHRCTFGDKDAPFIAVNCGAIPESLMEAELFGYEKGAFTGALRTKKGVFEQAEGGTLFLDEIGEMPAIMQVRLLRIIQERKVVRVGGETPIPLNLRLICATNKNLNQMVSDGKFREDLYYRINVVHIHIPPLCERREDILWFTHIFLDELVPGGEHYLLPSTEEQLLNHDWPGNLRELHHTLERACILATTPAIEPIACLGMNTDDSALETLEIGNDLKVRLNKYEYQVIKETLKRHKNQINETAIELGISRKNLWEKMRRLKINKNET